MSIKECFTSRFVGGYIVDIDFSQLEVVALAILSGDPVLREDIISGRDMHVMRAADLFEMPEAHISVQQRQLAKQLSFQLQYGAGAKSMAEKLGIPKALAEKFIFQYYDRYSRVKEWQNEVQATVKASRKPSERRTGSGTPAGVGVYDSPTGRLYKFFEYDSKWGSGESFSPTEMKNYPVQGFATGDIMALFRARLYRRLLADTEEVNLNVKLINTVHDSVMFDVSCISMVTYVYGVCKEVVESIPEELWANWGITCDVPLKIDCKYGPSWGDLEKLT